MKATANELFREEDFLEAAKLYLRAIDLAPDAAFIGVEPLILGRAAMGETVREARFRDAWRLRVDGRRDWSSAVALDVFESYL